MRCGDVRDQWTDCTRINTIRDSKKPIVGQHTRVRSHTLTHACTHAHVTTSVAAHVTTSVAAHLQVSSRVEDPHRSTRRALINKTDEPRRKAINPAYCAPRPTFVIINSKLTTACGEMRKIANADAAKIVFSFRPKHNII